MKYVDLWGWYNRLESQYYHEGDSARIKLLSYNNRKWQLKEKDPERAYALCQEAVGLAQRLNEPWWEAYYEYWACEMLTYYVGDWQRGLDAATRLVAKLSQPRYVGCPVAGRAYITLMAIYYERDAYGYQKEINEMLNFMEKDIPMDEDTYQRLQYFRAGMAYELEDYEASEAELYKYLNLARSAFRQQSAYNLLLRIEIARKHFDLALSHAEQFEETAREGGLEMSIAEASLWQAALNRKTGDAVAGSSHLMRGLTRASNLGVIKSREYFDAVGGYHEVGGDWEKALALRDEQIQYLDGRNNPDFIGDAHLKRCHVLHRMGKLTEADLQAARNAALELRDQAHYAKLLADVAAGKPVRGALVE
jgi:hypothetical protein